MENLIELGRKFGTDKAGPHVHTFNGVSFLGVYHRYFENLRNKNINFLELGILNGSSLKVWENYFENANIVGLDIDPSKSRYETDKTKVYIGSQSDKNLIDRIKNDYPDGFDVILDDASHINELTIESFNLLFPHLKRGGYYIIEDTHCTYGGVGFAENVKKWPGMQYNSDSVNFDNKRSDFTEFIEKLINILDFKQGEVFSIHFYSETLIIEKI